MKFTKMHGAGNDYIYVDWGPEFYARHSASFPNFIGPALSFNIGWIGLQHILENGGSGYFPARLVYRCIEDGRLTVMRMAPEFSLPAYILYPTDADPELFGPALAAMRDVTVADTP